MIKKLLRYQTISSFDYQWRNLEEGDAMLSNKYFSENVVTFLTEEMLAINKTWFPRREILDAGCGQGRWTSAFLELKSKVTAIDASQAALDFMKGFFDAPNNNNLRLIKENILRLSDKTKDRKYDLVYSFGVLHHTGDLKKAIKNVADLVAEDGLLFLYLYGRKSHSIFSRLKLELIRLALLPFPFNQKVSILKLLRPNYDTHQAFDLLSPIINVRSSFDEIKDILNKLGFTEVIQTIDSTELFVRANRESCSARPYFRQLATPPYWFEKY